MRWRRRVLKDDEETKERGWTEGRSAGALFNTCTSTGHVSHVAFIAGGESEDESEDES